MSASKETRIMKICRKCRHVCNERMCECGSIPEPYYAIRDLPESMAEQLRAAYLPLNTVDGLAHPPHNID